MSKIDTSELPGQPFTVCFTVPPAMLGDEAEIAKIDAALLSEIGSHLARLADGRVYQVQVLPAKRREMEHTAWELRPPAITRIVLVALRDWRECAVGECAWGDAISEDDWSDQYRRRTRNGFVFVWDIVEHAGTCGVEHAGIYRRVE